MKLQREDCHSVSSEKDIVISKDRENWISVVNLGRKFQRDNYQSQMIDRVSSELSNCSLRRNKQSFCTELPKNLNSEKEHSIVDLFFLVEQLHLFAVLCRGRNHLCIDMVSQYIKWDVALVGMTDRRLPLLIRAKFADLIVDVFIDAGNNMPLTDEIPLMYVYSSIPVKENLEGNEKLLRQNSLYDSRFDQLKKWMFRYVRRHRRMVASRIQENCLTGSILRLLHSLMRFGFFTVKEVDHISKPLMNLLDGRDDRPCPKRDRERFLFEKMQFRMKSRFLINPETAVIAEAKMKALEIFDLILNMNSAERLMRFLTIFKSAVSNLGQQSSSVLYPLLHASFNANKDEKLNMKAMFEFDELMQNTSVNTKMFHILLDLSHYSYDILVTSSLWLLHRLYSVNFELFSHAAGAKVVIKDTSIDVVDHVRKVLPLLCRMIGTKMTEEDQSRAIDILCSLRKLTHLDDSPDEPHPINQAIIHSSGILQDIIDLVTREVEDEAKGVATHRRVVQEALRVLRGAAMRNAVVQELLFAKFDVFCHVVGLELDLARLLIEIFSHNHRTSMHILPGQIEMIVQLAEKHRETCPELLQVLSTIVLPEERHMPLKRNQLMVNMSLLQHRKAFTELLHSPLPDLQALLRCRDDKKTIFLMHLVDLLATCAEGENRQVEAINRSFMSCTNALQVINDGSISFCVRSPFVRFLLCVYIAVEVEIASDIEQCLSGIWLFLSNVITILSDLKSFLNIESKHWLYRKQIILSNTFTLNSKELEIKENFQCLFSSIFPFLKFFFSNVFELQERDRSHLSDAINLAHLCMDLADTLLQLIQKPLSGILYIMAVEAMIKSIEKSEEVILNLRWNRKKVKFQNLSIIKHEREVYNQRYEREEELNWRLKEFAINFSIIYCGRNTLKAQLGFPSQQPYTNIGEPDELPLGAEFQAHAKCFIENENYSTEIQFVGVECLLRQLQISVNLPSRSERRKNKETELTVRSLQLLRRLLYSASVRLPKDEKSLNCLGEDFHKTAQALEDAQKALNSHDVMKSVLPLLLHPNAAVVRELLSFLLAILEGGNRTVQNSLFQYLENSGDDFLVCCLQHRLMQAATIIKEKFNTLSKKEDEEVTIPKVGLHWQAFLTSINALCLTDQRKLAEIAKLPWSQVGFDSEVSTDSSGGSSRRNTGVAINMNVDGGDVMRNNANTTINNNKSNSDAKRKKFSSNDGNEEDEEATESNESDEDEYVGYGDKHRPVESREEADEKKRLAETGKEAVSEVSKLSIKAENDGKGVKIEEDSSRTVGTYVTRPAKPRAVTAKLSQLPDLYFEKVWHVEQILRLLACMCEGQNMRLQDYFREQADNSRSSNLVGEVANFLSIIYSDISAPTIPLTTQVFCTLIEFASDNRANQAVIFEHRVCDFINFILRSQACLMKSGFSNEFEVKFSIAVLIGCLIEGGPSGPHSDLPAAVRASLDCEAMRLVVVRAHSLLTSGDFPQSDRTLVTEVGFRYFYLLDALSDIAKVDFLVSNKGEDTKEAFLFFEKITMTVEILKDGIVRKVYFRAEKEDLIQNEFRRLFNEKVDRSTPDSKLRDFTAWTKQMIPQLQFQQNSDAHSVSSFLQTSGGLYAEFCAISLSLWILLLLLLFRVSHSSSSAFMKVMMMIIKILHNIISIGLFLNFIHTNYSYDFRMRRFLENMRPPKTVDDTPEKFKLRVRCGSFKFITNLLFPVFSLSGTLFYPAFFAVHLLYIALHNRRMRRIFKAVGTKALPLAFLALLTFFLFLLFALLGFDNFPNEMPSLCDSYMHCFGTALLQGLTLQIHNASTLGYKRLADAVTFKIAAFLVLSVLMWGIALGILVDALCEMREQEWQIENDKRKQCFICGVGARAFQFHMGFVRHVKTEHNMWAYVLFLLHLHNCERYDLSSVERYVFDLFQEGRCDYFPLNSAISLQKDAPEVTKEKLDDLMDHLKLQLVQRESKKETNVFFSPTSRQHTSIISDTKRDSNEILLSL